MSIINGYISCSFLIILPIAYFTSFLGDPKIIVFNLGISNASSAILNVPNIISPYYSAIYLYYYFVSPIYKYVYISSYNILFYYIYYYKKSSIIYFIS